MKKIYLIITESGEAIWQHWITNSFSDQALSDLEEVLTISDEEYEELLAKRQARTQASVDYSQMLESLRIKRGEQKEERE